MPKPTHITAYNDFAGGKSINEVSVQYGIPIRYLRAILRKIRYAENLQFERRLKK